MGKCIYCGENAGFFRRKHNACEIKNIEGQKRYFNEINKSILDISLHEGLAQRLDRIGKDSFLSEQTRNQIIVKTFDQSVAKVLEDGILSSDEENHLAKFVQQLGLSQNLLDRNGSYQKIGMSSVLRNILDGKIDENRLNILSPLPFLFQKSEKLVWVFTEVAYFETRTKTEFRGGSQGVSIRVAKGLYYRTSAFKGRPVQTSEMKDFGTGIMALTTKHIYFNSLNKKFKIPFNKMIALEPYEDGIGIQRDGVTAKPQTFKNVDGWFLYNAITNLNNM
jgi:hypothetical protein